MPDGRTRRSGRAGTGAADGAGSRTATIAGDDADRSCSRCTGRACSRVRTTRREVPPPNQFSMWLSTFVAVQHRGHDQRGERRGESARDRHDGSGHRDQRHHRESRDDHRDADRGDRGQMRVRDDDQRPGNPTDDRAGHEADQPPEQRRSASIRSVSSPAPIARPASPARRPAARRRRWRARSCRLRSCGSAVRGPQLASSQTTVRTGSSQLTRLAACPPRRMLRLRRAQ